MAVLRNDIIEFLESEAGVDLDEINDDTALFSSGFVDSFALVTLMMHIEKLGGFRIDPTDVTLDNLDSINRILVFASSLDA